MTLGHSGDELMFFLVHWFLGFVISIFTKNALLCFAKNIKAAKVGTGVIFRCFASHIDFGPGVPKGRILVALGNFWSGEDHMPIDEKST